MNVVDENTIGYACKSALLRGSFDRVPGTVTYGIGYGECSSHLLQKQIHSHLSFLTVIGNFS